MRLREFSSWLTDELEKLDHNEIVKVTNRTDPDRNPNHVFLAVRFASGATGSVGAVSVRGPGVPRHEPYSLPKEAF